MRLRWTGRINPWEKIKRTWQRRGENTLVCEPWDNFTLSLIWDFKCILNFFCLEQQFNTDESKDPSKTLIAKAQGIQTKRNQATWHNAEYLNKNNHEIQSAFILRTGELIGNRGNGKLETRWWTDTWLTLLIPLCFLWHLFDAFIMTLMKRVYFWFHDDLFWPWILLHLFLVSVVCMWTLDLHMHVSL